jgi:ATP-dependent Clp protease adaptor protein ClpS
MERKPITLQRFEDDERRQGEPGLLTQTRPRIKRPPLYKVLLLNDDFTPMDFVVHVLQKFFRLPLERATEVMLAVHKKGLGLCGIYTFEVAETKVRAVVAYAKHHQHPLQCTMEPEAESE